MGERVNTGDIYEEQVQTSSRKLRFLHQEIHELQADIKWYQVILKVNKDALKLATSWNRYESVSAAKEESGKTRPPDQILDMLYTEHAKLNDVLEKVKFEKKFAQQKALLNELISEESQLKENETIAELQNRIAEITEVIQEKEAMIRHMEKISWDARDLEAESYFMKYIDIMIPNAKISTLHMDTERAKLALLKVLGQVGVHKREKEKMKQFHWSLIQEVSAIKAALMEDDGDESGGILSKSSYLVLAVKLKPNFLDYKSDMNASTKLLDVIGKSYLNDGSGSDSDSGDEHIFPEKVRPTKNNIKEGSKKNLNIPKLDLTQAKKIQEITAKKISQQTQPQLNILNTMQNPPPKDPQKIASLQEKIQRLEAEVTNVKKTLSYEILASKKLGEEVQGLQTISDKLLAANDLLIKANHKYNHKLKLLNSAVGIYQEFYHKYLDAVSQKRVSKVKMLNDMAMVGSPNMRRLKELAPFDLGFQDTKAQTKDFLRVNKAKLVQDSVRETVAKQTREHKGNKPRKTSIDEIPLVIDGHDERHKSPNRDTHNTFDKERAFQKTTIRSPMKGTKKNDITGQQDLFRNPSAAAVKNIFKLKRSVSNPLDYLETKKENIFVGKAPRGGDLRPSSKNKAQNGTEAKNHEDKEYDSGAKESHSILKNYSSVFPIAHAEINIDQYYIQPKQDKELKEENISTMPAPNPEPYTYFDS